jgi:hypothetical protein
VSNGGKKDSLLSIELISLLADEAAMKTLRNLLGAILAIGLSIPFSPMPRSALSADSATGFPPDAHGFIQNWMILEPIRLAMPQLTEPGVQAAVKHEYFDGQLTSLPKDGEKVAVDGASLTWHAVATHDYNVNTYHFAHALGKPTSNVLFWGVTVMNAPREMKGVRLAIGCNASSVWWVNGKEVIGNYGDRQTVIDDAVSKRLTLNKGANVVRFALINAGGATDYCARFLNADEEPLREFTVSVGDAQVH